MRRLVPLPKPPGPCKALNIWAWGWDRYCSKRIQSATVHLAWSHRVRTYTAFNQSETLAKGLKAVAVVLVRVREIDSR